MKIIYEDLIYFLNEKPSKELLSEKLFQLGHEHEIHGEILDMELTPNRGDCLSLFGLARDLNIFFGNSKTLDIYEDNIDELKIDFENLSPLECPKISFLEIEIDEIKESYKPYLENFFSISGNKKTNLFTDISNYLSYELGQPTHCFDRNAITGKLTFQKKDCSETFKTLLGSKVVLENKNCVFSMDNEIISLAGIMGGASTACSTKTKKVLVECAYFNPESIIGKSVKYNLNSEAAHKFERGVDIASQEIVLRRFIKVAEDHANVKSIKLKSFGPTNFNNISIPIDVYKINKVLGTSLEESEYLKYLADLNFDISDDIKVPLFRHDIKTNNDLAEEIARAIGYNNIKSSPIKLIKISDSNESKIMKIESLLTKNGFSEVINFPFTSKKEKGSINLDNPLDSNRKNLRISLKESLINNLLYNERRQRESIKLFEISDIYTKDKEIKQHRKLGIIISGRLGNNYNDFSKKLDQSYLYEILNDGLSKDEFKIIQIPRDELITKRKDKIFYVEIALEDISHTFFSSLTPETKNINFVKYKPISEYPLSKRDFSFSINELSKVDEVINILDNISDEIIKNSFMFDFYKNDSIGIVKLGYRFIFQSHYKTLSDLDINNKVEEILNPILKIEGVSIPGM